MPTDLSAVRELLPWWVLVGAWVATPVVLCLGALLFAAFCDLFHRPKMDGLHWTEKARLHYADNRSFGFLVLTQIVFVALVTQMAASGLLLGGEAGVRVALTACGAWLLVMAVRLKRSKRTMPWFTLRDYVNGYLFYWAVFYPFLVIAAAMAIFGPAGFVGSELRFVLVFGGGLLLMALVIRGHHMAVASWLGIVRPADERTNAIVAEAARRSGHVPERSWIGRTPMANAAALPSSNQVLVTSRALEQMTDEQLVAVMLHEFGHLKESRKSRATRLLGLLFVIAAAMWQPLIAWFTVYGWVAILVACLVLATKVGGAIQKLESDADEHAHDHGGEHGGALYARSLERLHELNLMPAVLPGKKQTHPHLYDRMLAAGATPDYERPEPPGKNLRKVVLLSFVSLGLFVAQAEWLQVVRFGRFDGVDAAMLDLALRGRDADSLGTLGGAWQEDQPEKAEVMLRAAVARSPRPVYSLGLARLLCGRDPDAAKDLLQQAEQELARWDQVGEWFVKTVDELRERLGLPKKNW